MKRLHLNTAMLLVVISALCSVLVVQNRQAVRREAAISRLKAQMIINSRIANVDKESRRNLQAYLRQIESAKNEVAWKGK